MDLLKNKKISKLKTPTISQLFIFLPLSGWGFLYESIKFCLLPGSIP
jgi:hypothetical protein